MTEKRILKLVLSQAAYDITGTPEKMFELRLSSKWIEQRLIDKNNPGKYRKYDYIEFQCGYKKNAEKKQFKFIASGKWDRDKTFFFSNGLSFKANKGDYMIVFTNL